MDSEVPVSSPLEQPQDIGAAAAAARHSSEDPPSGGDDGFETASDPDADDSAALPAAPIVVEDEDSTHENPNPEGNSPAKSSPPALPADAGVVSEEKATADAAEEKLVPGSGEPGQVAAGDEPDAAEPVVDEEKKAVGDVQDEKFEDAPEEVEELVPVGSLADSGVTVTHAEGDGNWSKEEAVIVAGDKDGVADDALLPAGVDGNLEPEENLGRRVLGVEEQGTDSGLLKEENPASVEAEPQIVMVDAEKKGVPDTGDEKEKSLVDGESAPVADPAEGVVVASEPAVEVPDAGKVVAGAGKEEVLDAVDVNSEESRSTAVEGVDESKTVGDVIAIGSDGVLDALNAKDESLGVSGFQHSSTVQGSEGSSSLRDELVAAEVADDAGPKQNLEVVADLKAVGVKSDAIEVGKDGGAVAAYQSDALIDEIDSKSVEAESSAAENEKAGADNGASSVQGLVMVNDSSLDPPKLEVTEPRVGPEGADNGEVSTEGSLAVDFESARSLDSADKPDGGNAIGGVGVDVKDGFVSEKANDSVNEHDIGSDGEGLVDEGVVPKSSNLFSVQGVESSTILGEKSKGEEVEPVFFSDRAVKSEAVGGQVDGQGVEDEKVVPESSDINSLQGVESSPVLEVSKSGKVEPVSFSEWGAKPEAVRAQPDGEGVGDEKMVPESIDLISDQHVESSPVPEDKSSSGEVEPVSFLDQAVKLEADEDQATAASTDDEKLGLDETEEEGLFSEGPARVAILESSETAKLIIKDMEEGSASPHSGFRSSGEHSEHMDGQIVSDSEEEADTDEEDEGRELFDSAALTALLKAATGSSADGGVTISQEGTRIFSVDRPVGLGSSIPALRPASLRSSRPSPFSPSDLSVVGEPENNMDENEKKLQEKVEQIRIKFLRLVQRLGHSPDDTVAAQVLYRLGLAEGIRRGRQIGRAFSIESTKKKALQLEEDQKEDLDFSCNILVLGKTGVGKSTTINSIFGESKSLTSAFLPATTSVREITGTVDGVKIHVIDTPGLRASVMDQAANKKVLQSIKKYTKRCPPDIVLYVDRIDTQTRDFNDLPLLKSVTTVLGSSIWFNAIVALSHAASAPPDGPSGSPLSYEVLVAQRSHVVQHSIRQAAGDMRLMNPVALVENHPSCRRNREGERVLPNGLSWRPQLLLLCYSSKILSEANSLLKLQDPSPGKLFGFRLRSPPLPYLLSSLLQSRTHPKLSTDQGGDNGDSDIDLDDLSDTDQEEEEDEYDQLPPFKPLRKSQIAKLTKDQRRAYFDEYDYRVKLLQKKQWKEELRRMKDAKIKGKTQKDDFAYGDMMDDYDQDGAPAAVPVPLPDMVLPPSFDCNNPVYRYRFLEPTSQLLIRPVLDSHGFDHDCGYDGVSIEENLAVAGRFPAVAAVQITKDKKEFNLHLDSSISAKHGEYGSSIAGFDIQSIGKQFAYIVRGETKFKILKKNKTAAGVSVTFLGETVATGLKVEDQISIGKRVNLVASAGGVRAQGDVAYGANLEARLRDKDYPLGQTLSTLGLSLMKWRSDLALGANLQSQFSIGRNSKMSVRVGLNNKLSGQITVRTSTSEQLQIALVAILPLAISFFRSISPGESYMDN